MTKMATAAHRELWTRSAYSESPRIRDAAHTDIIANGIIDSDPVSDMSRSVKSEMVSTCA